MKIAIIGTGISGLGISYLLNKTHDITIYEKNDYIGGHSRTINVKIADTLVPVDTGFIVFNYKNYPNFSSLLKYLNIPVTQSSMSFGVSINNGLLEYSTSTISSLITQKINCIKVNFWKMLYDILKFNRHAEKYLNDDILLIDLINKLNLGNWFKKYYLLPMSAAIWSTPINKIQNIPAKTLIKFFDNHGLLTVSNQPQWYSIEGGSSVYVNKIIETFKNNIRLNCEVTKVIRENDLIKVYDNQNKVDIYDEIIFACHSDQALKILDNPTLMEVKILQNIMYESNTIVVHSDTNFMPKSKKAWASWVYLSDEEVKNNSKCSISLSYWMNNLQSLNTKKPIFVTLNPSKRPKNDLIYNEYTFEHPILDLNAIKAQQEISSIQGHNRTWFCGAWQSYGFHEDGLLSALNIARKMNIEIPWK